MGRASRIHKVVLEDAPQEGARVPSLPGIRRDITHEEVGSQWHLARLRDYAIARYSEQGKDPADISVRFENFCNDCGHRLEAHIGDGPQNHGPAPCRGKSPNGAHCGCRSYYPGGGSYTDMKGNIVVQSDLPPGGEAWERQVCIWGLLRHEISHELHTTRAVHLRLEAQENALRQSGEDPFYKQIYKCFNILEDGRIENIDRTIYPGSYRYIEGLNALSPRVTLPEADGYTQGTDRVYMVPRGYTALDAHGNELKDITDSIDPHTGREVSLLRVPAGTDLRTWGPRPVSPAHQMRAALLATAVPGFEPGELHPDVQKALDECMPHITSVTRPPATTEEKERRYAASTEECADAAEAVYAILKKHNLLLPPDEENEEPRRGGRPGKEGEDGDGDGDGSKGTDGEEDGEEDGEGGEGEGGEGEEGEGEEGEGKGEESEGDDSGQGGSQGEGKGYDKEAQLPEEARRQRAQEVLDELRGEIEEGMESDRSKAVEDAQKRRREGDFRSEDIEPDSGQSVIPQEQLEQDIFSFNSNTEALEEEQGRLRALGEDLASQLELIRAHEEMLIGGQMHGELDTSRLSQAMAGDPRVYSLREMPSEQSAEVSIVIDRSGSTSGDEEDQYRMAVMCGHAAAIAGVPTGIYGYSEGDDVEHYTYKEPESDSLVGLGAIFKTGGGITPTQEAIDFNARKLEKRGAQEKIMVVVTDGSPSGSLQDTIREVEEARQQGIEVVGVGFNFREGSDAESNMRKIFGEGNWKNINEYTEVPSIVSGLIARSLGYS